MYYAEEKAIKTELRAIKRNVEALMLEGITGGEDREKYLRRMRTSLKLIGFYLEDYEDREK